MVGDNLWHASGVEELDLSYYKEDFKIGVGDYINSVVYKNAGDGEISVGLSNFKWITTSNVPEPVTISLLGIGFLGLAGFRLRRK